MAKYKPTVKGDSSDLLFIDYTPLAKTLKLDFPCMFVVMNGTVISVVFKTSFKSNDGTKAAVLSPNSYTYTVTSFDLVVNGYVISRRRYGNPGVKAETAYEDGRNLLEGLLSGVKDAIDGVSTNDDSSGIKLTTINTFPSVGTATSLNNLLKNSVK